MSPSFQIISDKNIHDCLSEKGVYELIPSFFLLMKTGNMIIQNAQEHHVGASTISVSAKQESLLVSNLS